MQSIADRALWRLALPLDAFAPALPPVPITLALEALPALAEHFGGDG